MSAFFHLTGNDVALPSSDYKVLRHYALRALLPAGADDTVILHGLPYPTDLLRLFNRLEIGPHPDRVFTHLSRARGTTLQTFSGAAPRVWALSDQFGCRLDAPSFEVCITANSKSWFQRTFGDNTLASLPPGAVCRFADVPMRASALMREHGRAVRLKDPHSASGIKQMVLPLGSDVSARLPHGRMDQQVVLQVEQHRDADASVQGHVTRDGEVIVGQVTGQHISGQGSHGGNFFPSGLPEWAEVAMRDSTRAVGEGLVRLGYFGPYSVDFVIDFEACRVYAVECNARVTAPQYPIRALQTWYGEAEHRPFDLFSVRVASGTSVDAVANALNGTLFSRVLGIGVVPFVVLPQFGLVVCTVFATSEAHRDYLSSEVRHLLLPLR